MAWAFEPLARGIDLHHHLEPVRITDGHERQELVEQGELVGKWNQSLRSGPQEIAITSGERGDKRGASELHDDEGVVLQEASTWRSG